MELKILNDEEIIDILSGYEVKHRRKVFVINADKALLQAQAKLSYEQGYAEALRDYAWWQDGIQYVGCGVKTLEQALRETAR